MQEALITHIAKHVALEKQQEERLLSFFQRRRLKKKEYLLREGQICSSHFFIEKGCMRLYAITERGGEQIIQFGIDNWWISDYNSLENQRPSVFNIQAVEDTEGMLIDREAQSKLLAEMPQLEKYFRIMFQRAYTASLMRIQYIYCLSAEERYRQFSTNFPGFVQRVPQYMLASFLGFTPEFLSKTRAKKRQD